MGLLIKSGMSEVKYREIAQFVTYVQKCMQIPKFTKFADFCSFCSMILKRFSI